MRFSSLVLGSVALALELATADRTPFSDVKANIHAPSQSYVLNAYIIELDSAANLNSIPGPRRALISPHKELYRRLDERAVQYQVRKEFNDEIFTGLSINLPNTRDIETVAAISGIKTFSPLRKWSAPNPVDEYIPSSPSDSALPPDTESTHIMTGVDKLHAQGIFGKGVLIGIIDSGIDYTHPALGGKFGPGNKVAIGYDFVGDNYNGSNTPVPDPDPLDQCAGHGTHVAGIVGANPGNEYNISGVAYQSTLAAYRVFGCSGPTSDDIIIEALMRAYNDGCNVISLSIVAPDGWTEAVSGVVASRIADKGRVVTVAAGNEGASGAWYSSNISNGISVISVASVENTVITEQGITTSTGFGPILIYDQIQPYTLPSGFSHNKFYPTHAISNDTGVIGDGCNPLPDSTPDLSGKIVVVRRGSCSFVTKLANIAAKGGNMSLIYDNIVETPFTSFVTPYFGVIISASDGAYLVNQFAAGTPVQVKFPITDVVNVVDSPFGGLMNDFSSWGPSNDMFFKPAVAAPGGSIVSTYPVPLGSYALLSGTSAATPFVAGSAALMLQKFGKGANIARSVRTVFETTALALPQSKAENSPLQSLTQAGAGLINVYNALTYKTTLTPGELLLNDTRVYTCLLFQIMAPRPRRIMLSMSLPDGVQPALGPVPQSTDYATVQIVPSRVTLRPGQTVGITVSIKPPASGDKSLFQVFTGFIQVTGSLGENVHASYLGLNAKTTDLKVIDNTDYYFGFTIPAFLNSTGDFQAPGTNYTLAGEDYPTLLYRLASGSPAVYVDLVNANTTFVPTDTAARRSENSEVDVFERSWWYPGASYGNGKGTYSKVKTVGPIEIDEYLPRNPDDTFENGGYQQVEPTTFANGTAIPNGSYKLLLRALRISGDAKSESSYDSWLSTAFNVV